jgi:ABC-type multidrug transport system fused ATPase/permease subunit
MSIPHRSPHFSFFDLPRALWYFLGPERWTFLFFSGVLLAVFCYVVVPPYIVGLITNFLIDYLKGGPAHASLAPLFWLAGLLAASYAAVALIRLSSKRVTGRISLNARYRAKVWGFERLLDASLSWHHQESTGNKAQRLLTGAEAVREWADSVLKDALNTTAVFATSLVASILLHPAFIVFFVIYFGGLIGTEMYFDRRIDHLSDHINKSLENSSGGFVESASNILSVKALGAAESMANNLAEREELTRRLSYERLRLGNSKWMCFQIHNGICWGLYVLGVGYMVIHGKLSPGFFLTYSTYFDKLRQTATEFTDQFQSMIERKSNVGRMMPLFWTDSRLPSGNRKFPSEWQDIHLRDAVFHYDNKPAVGPLSLELKRGEIIGIAGPSGSGKSTLIKLLLGLYHLDSGVLAIGDVPIEEIQHEDLISNIAVVLQETELFNLTLRENITMLRDAPPALLQRSCEIACLQDVIRRLPEGLDTMIGERGYTLSGGERQRVGIARAICRNAPILLLDEATSALDSATEQMVMERLLAEHQDDRIMIIVAHRISTLRDADKVLVFDRGRLVEQGSFQELVDDSSSRFGMMSTIQSTLNPAAPELTSSGALKV